MQFNVGKMKDIEHVKPSSGYELDREKTEETVCEDLKPS